MRLDVALSNLATLGSLVAHLDIVIVVESALLGVRGLWLWNWGRLVSEWDVDLLATELLLPDVVAADVLRDLWLLALRLDGSWQLVNLGNRVITVLDELAALGCRLLALGSGGLLWSSGLLRLCGILSSLELLNLLGGQLVLWHLQSSWLRISWNSGSSGWSSGESGWGDDSVTTKGLDCLSSGILNLLSLSGVLDLLGLDVNELSPVAVNINWLAKVCVLSFSIASYRYRNILTVLVGLPVGATSLGLAGNLGSVHVLRVRLLLLLLLLLVLLVALLVGRVLVILVTLLILIAGLVRKDLVILATLEQLDSDSIVLVAEETLEGLGESWDVAGLPALLSKGLDPSGGPATSLYSVRCIGQTSRRGYDEPF